MRTVPPLDYEDKALATFEGTRAIGICALDDAEHPTMFSVLVFDPDELLPAFERQRDTYQSFGDRLTEPVEVLVEWRNRLIPTIRAGVVATEQQLGA